MIDLQNILGLTFVFPGDFRRRAQERLLDEEITANLPLGDRSLQDLPVMYGATDLVTGNVVGISARGILTQTITRPLAPSGFFLNFPKEDEKEFRDKIGRDIHWSDGRQNTWLTGTALSSVVAASGGFPAAFEPLSIDNMQLVDGGVSDNSGLTLLLDADFLSKFCSQTLYADLSPWQSDLVISSNAGKSYGQLEAEVGPLRGLSRSIDTLYSRTGLRPIYSDENLYEKYAPSAIRLDPSDLLSQPGQVDYAIVERFLKLPQADQDLVIRIFSDDTHGLTSTDKRGQSGRDGRVSESEPGVSRDFVSWLEFPELLREITAFSSASTLNAIYSEEDAERLYRLGFILVALNLQSIRHELASPSRIITPDPTHSTCYKDPVQ